MPEQIPHFDLRRIVHYDDDTVLYIPPAHSMFELFWEAAPGLTPQADPSMASIRRVAMTSRPWHLRLWSRMIHWSITIEGEMIWWCGDDRHERVRKIDIEIRWPKWIFRPICWLTVGHSDYYGECVRCAKPMPGRKVKRHG